MEFVIVLMEGSMLCDEGMKAEKIYSIEECGDYTYEELKTKTEIENYGYYVTGFKYVCTINGTVYVRELDENSDFVKETQI